MVECTKEGLLFRIVPRLVEMAGKYSKFGEVEGIKKEIEKQREEY